jgi:hypothetical protein
MATTIKSAYFRHRLFSRVRYRRKLKSFLAAEVTALAGTATGQTVAPIRASGIVAEATILVPGNLANADTLTIGDSIYTLVTALTEAKATDTLTNSGVNVTAADTVTIDGRVYTFRAALTEAKATDTLTNSGVNLTNGDTVTVGGKTYTFQSALTNVDGNVKIGAANTNSMTNLFNAINGTGGVPGTDYAAATVANTLVSATNPTGTTVLVTAKTPGVAGNAIAATKVAVTLTWGSATLLGGVDPILNEVKIGAANTNSMTNLFEAINAGANAGTDYATGTVIHPTVTATNPTGTTVLVTAKTPGVAGNAIGATKSAVTLTWGTATLIGGINSVAGQVVVGGTAANTRDNLIAAITGGAGASTTYAFATPVHAKVTAVASGANLLVQALLGPAFTPGFTVKLAKSAANLTLPTLPQLDGPLVTATAHAFVEGEGPYLLTNAGGALPAGWPTTPVFVHVVDANTVALATSREAMGRGNFILNTTAGTGTQTATREVTQKGIFGLFNRNKPRTVAAASDVDNLK